MAERVVAALAVGAADRDEWAGDREHVEAEIADIGQPGDHVVEGAVAFAGSPDCDRGNSSYQALKAAARRSTQTSKLVVVLRERIARGLRGPWPRRLRAREKLEPIGFVARSPRSVRGMPSTPLRAGSLATATTALEQRASPSSTSRRNGLACAALLQDLLAPSGEQVAPRNDRVRVAPDLSEP